MLRFNIHRSASARYSVRERFYHQALATGNYQQQCQKRSYQILDYDTYKVYSSYCGDSFVDVGFHDVYDIRVC